MKRSFFAILALLVSLSVNAFEPNGSHHHKVKNKTHAFKDLKSTICKTNFKLNYSTFSTAIYIATDKLIKVRDNLKTELNGLVQTYRVHGVEEDEIIFIPKVIELDEEIYSIQRNINSLYSCAGGNNIEYTRNKLCFELEEL